MNKILTKIGHRGAPREFPANTLRSFLRAVERGCTMVECDIRPAVDGVLVLAHDESVTDFCGDTYLVAEQESRFLHALNLGAGEGVPTLDELVALANSGHFAIMADMKCEGGGVEEKVAAALTPLPVALKVVPGAETESRKRFRELDPTLPLSLSLNADYPLPEDPSEFRAFLETVDTDAVTWQHPLLTSERIALLHERGLTVYAWTVDDLPTLQRLLDWGVDGLISNRADLLEAL